jgi:hypothetical protein
MWRDEPADDPCDAPDDWEPLPVVLVGAPTQDDLEFAELVTMLDDGPWHALDAVPCPVCLWPKPCGAESCGDADCMLYAGAIVLVRLDEPFGGELAAE